MATKSMCSTAAAHAKENSDEREERSPSCAVGQTQFTPKDWTLLSNWAQSFRIHALRACTKTYSGSWGKKLLSKCRSHKHKPASSLLQNSNPAGKGSSGNACAQESIAAQIMQKKLQKEKSSWGSKTCKKCVSWNYHQGPSLSLMRALTSSTQGMAADVEQFMKTACWECNKTGHKIWTKKKFL